MPASDGPPGSDVPRLDVPAGSTLVEIADDVSLLPYINVVLRRRFLVVGVAAAVAAFVAGYQLLLPRTYTSSASFIAQFRTSTAGLSAVAAQLGLTSPGAEAGRSPAFYADLLVSREVLARVVGASLVMQSDGGIQTGTLTELYRISGKDERLRRDAAVRLLRRSISVNLNNKTGLLRFSVKARDALVAEQVTSRVLAELGRFNLESRQSQAAAERRFTEERLVEVREDLRAAEDRLQSFLERNRDYRNSPVLTFQQDRLARDVALKQQLYTTLAQAFEQAKIEEVRDTPVLTVVERPEVPVQPDPRHLARNSVLALFLGAVLGGMMVIAASSFAEAGTRDSEGLEEFQALGRVALNELRHPLRALQAALRRHQAAEAKT